MITYSRRCFIKLASYTTFLTAAPNLVYASKNPNYARELAFYNVHTGEILKLTYWEYGQYIQSSLLSINYLLRDYRTNEVHSIEPKLFDQLYFLQKLVEKSGYYHVISGYRSAATNSFLHAHSKKVANKSLHMQGQAIDIFLPGKNLKQLHTAALSMLAGGVGYYPKSNFIHLDTGKVRHWS